MPFSLSRLPRIAERDAALFAFLFLLAGVLGGCDYTVQIGDPGTEGPLGDAIDEPGEWEWAPVAGAQCRDGSETGFGARLQEGSRDLLIYLEGGGACFNGATCERNQSNFGRFTFQGVVVSGRGEDGIFNTSNRAGENPFSDWNAAYVPYCTGDVHAGSAANVVVEGVDSDSDGSDDLQQFVGHRNVELYLGILADEYAGELDRVLLTGSSAGGFGALVNYEAVQAAFPEASVTLLDDSGPPVGDDDVLSPALEQLWIDLWDFETTLSDGANDAVAAGGGLAAIYDYYASRYSNRSFGLLSYLQDGTIRNFYGFEQPDCAVPGECVSGEAYARALQNVREQQAADWSTYYVEGTDHTFLVGERFYDVNVGGTPLSSWAGDLVDGGSTPEDVGP